MPAGAVYSFSPSSITAVTSASNSALSITLPAYHPVTLAQLGPYSPLHSPYAPLTAAALIGMCLGLRRRRLPGLTKLIPLVLLGALGLGALSLSGCTGGYPVASGVAPGTYSLVITASSANGLPSTVTPPFLVPSTHTVNVNLIVQ